MNGLFLSAVLALALTSGVAMAQTTASEVTTTTTPVIVAPPEGTLSVTRTQKTIDPDGTQTSTHETTYHNTNGVADDSVTRTTIIPPADITTTTTKSSTTTTE